MSKVNFRVEGNYALKKGTSGSAGLDIAITVPFTLEAGGTSPWLPTGVYIDEIPKNTFVEVRDRSSNVASGIRVFPGTIDSDYEGEIKIHLTNVGKSDLTFGAGAYLAQLVVIKIERGKETSDVERGDRGFGSTDLEEPAVEEPYDSV